MGIGMGILGLLLKTAAKDGIHLYNLLRVMLPNWLSMGNVAVGKKEE
jgi:hypothetical protein